MKLDRSVEPILPNPGTLMPALTKWRPADQEAISANSEAPLVKDLFTGEPPPMNASFTPIAGTPGSSLLVAESSTRKRAKTSFTMRGLMTL